jgi:hypothetical protein
VLEVASEAVGDPLVGVAVAEVVVTSSWPWRGCCCAVAEAGEVSIISTAGRG